MKKSELINLIRETINEMSPKIIPFDEKHKQAGIKNIPITCFKWFDDKEPMLSPTMVKNIVELRHRLVWLSEGSLFYQIKGGKYWGPQGNPSEVELYRRFRRYCAGISDNTV